MLPALLCNYFGQAALLLGRPEEAHHPFYALAPRWSLVPLVLLATAATIIASQAIISGAFSLTQQAIQLGYLPRLRVIHTSPTEIGQIYIPQVNWLLMVATIGLFLVVDLAFFSANISKILHGAWFPLVIGAVVFTMLTTWRRGRSILAGRLYDRSISVQEFIEMIEGHPPTRVPGKAVFMTGSTDAIPPALLHNLKHNKVLHTQVALLTITSEDTPRVPREEKVQFTDLGHGFFRVVAHYGFMEEPSVPYVLALAREGGLNFELAETSFFLGREKLLSHRRPAFPRWRLKLFAFMSRNAVSATEFFNIPPGQVVELGTQVAI